jgi:ubiquinol-cytochrome c reductase cytochrome c subunit
MANEPEESVVELTSGATPASEPAQPSARPTGSKPARRRSPFRRSRWAAYAVLLVALMGVGSAYGFATSRSGVAAVGDPSQQVEAGRALYLQGCSSCHGTAAQGGTDAPSLIGVGAAAVDFQVSTGRMPLKNQGAQAERKPARYTPEQIADLAAYVASLAPGPAIPGKDQYTPTEPDIGYGGNLFRTNCSSCHNFVGAGGALADGKHAPALYDATDKEIYEAMLTGPGTMPVFGDKQLTAQEKQDIIAYLNQMKAVPDPGGANLGRSGAVAEGLVAFLAGMTVLAGVAMWIGARAKRAA